MCSLLDHVTDSECIPASPAGTAVGLRRWRPLGFCTALTVLFAFHITVLNFRLFRTESYRVGDRPAPLPKTGRGKRVMGIDKAGVLANVSNQFVLPKLGGALNGWRG
jgi:hypothetical protein